jgi:hypothetical protein
MGVMVNERTEEGRDDMSLSLVGVRVPYDLRLASLRWRDRTLVAMMGGRTMLGWLIELREDRRDPTLLDRLDETLGRFGRAPAVDFLPFLVTEEVG